jgi:hypothetical protein
MVEAAHPAAEEPPLPSFKRKGLSDTELQNCQRAFKAMDKEHTGTISLTELTKVRCHALLPTGLRRMTVALRQHRPYLIIPMAALLAGSHSPGNFNHALLGHGS